MKRISKGKGVMRGIIFAAVLCVAAAGTFSVTCSAAEIRIVSIDTQRVFSGHPAFHEAMGKFQVQIEDMQKKLEGMDEEAKGMAQQMMQQQMQNLGMQLQEEAFGRMKADVQKFAKKKGYTYIVDSNMLIVGGKDVTEEVLASFPKPEPKKVEVPPAEEKEECPVPPAEEKK
jgi:Skp family chaperone for outer membrane proteins